LQWAFVDALLSRVPFALAGLSRFISSRPLGLTVPLGRTSTNADVAGSAVCRTPVYSVSSAGRRC